MSEQNNKDMALIGVTYDGRVTAALALRHSTKKDVREFYRDMADTDREVQRTTVDDARTRLEF